MIHFLYLYYNFLVWWLIIDYWLFSIRLYQNSVKILKWSWMSNFQIIMFIFVILSISLSNLWKKFQQSHVSTSSRATTYTHQTDRLSEVSKAILWQIRSQEAHWSSRRCPIYLRYMWLYDAIEIIISRTYEYVKTVRIFIIED